MPQDLPRPAIHRAVDARTLYLAAPGRLRITSTGEALVINDDAGAAQRIPVARLMRIVSSIRAEWSGAALALCMERGIPVSWLGSRDESLGHLWPLRCQPAQLAEVLDLLATDDPEWPEAYGHWLRRERLQVLKRWATERAAANAPVSVEEWQRAKRAWVYRAEVGDVLPALLRSMAEALVASNLSEQGLRPRYWGLAEDPIALAADLNRLVWAGMNLCSGPLAAAITRPCEAAALFERWSGICAGSLQAHLLSLHGRARRQLDA